MKTCVKCFIKTLNVMQAISKYELTDTIRFVEQQIAFTIESTTKMRTYHIIRTPPWKQIIGMRNIIIL